jgi:hypothetical protein
MWALGRHRGFQSAHPRASLPEWHTGSPRAEVLRTPFLGLFAPFHVEHGDLRSENGRSQRYF